MKNINLESEAGMHLSARYSTPYITGNQLHTPFGAYPITDRPEMELREKGYRPYMSTEGGYYIVFANNNDCIAYRNY